VAKAKILNPAYRQAGTKEHKGKNSEEHVTKKLSNLYIFKTSNNLFDF
jgi:hypothetical protein